MEVGSLFSKETLAKITRVAPLIGSLLGPGGAAAGAVIKMAASALGVEEKPEAIEAEILANPDALLKFKEMEAGHKVEFEKLLLERERIRLADVQDARKRQTDSEKITGKSDGNLYAMAWLGILGYLGLIVYLIRWGLPEMTPELALMVGNLIGIVGAKYSGIFDYFFGSSQGSAQKTAMLSRKEG